MSRVLKSTERPVCPTCNRRMKLVRVTSEHVKVDSLCWDCSCLVAMWDRVHGQEIRPDRIEELI